MALQSVTALSNITLQSAASEVTFSNIPQNYADLILYITYAVTTNTDSPYFQVNSTASDYSIIWMLGSSGNTISSSTSGPRAQIPVLFAVGATTGDGTNDITMQFINYSSTDRHKQILIRSNSSTNETVTATARWQNTNAINSIRFSSTALGSTIKAGTTFSLYGRIS